MTKTFRIKDITEITDGKIKPAFEISKEVLTPRDAIEIFRAFSRYTRHFSGHHEDLPEIEERDGNVIISYYNNDKNLEKAHEKFKRLAKDAMRRLDGDFEFKETNPNYDVGDNVYSKLIKRLKDYGPELPCKEGEELEWFKRNISKSVMPIDALVNGKRAYMEGFVEKDGKRYLKITPYGLDSHRFDSMVGKDEDALILLDEVKSAYKNIVDRLGITEFPMTMFGDSFLVELLWDEPEYFLKAFSERAMYSKATKLYNTHRGEAYEKFWRAILEKEEYATKLDNPLLKEREKELKLFAYCLTGEAYKGDGWETWKSDLDHLFISERQLSEDKLKHLYTREYGSEIRDVCWITVTKEELPGRLDRATFVEVGNDGKYITRPAEWRFKQLLRKKKEA